MWVQIQINRLPDIPQCLLPGLALRPTAFQRRAMRDKIAILAWLNDNFQVHELNLIFRLKVFKGKSPGDVFLGKNDLLTKPGEVGAGGKHFAYLGASFAERGGGAQRRHRFRLYRGAREFRFGGNHATPKRRRARIPSCRRSPNSLI